MTTLKIDQLNEGAILHIDYYRTAFGTDHTIARAVHSVEEHGEETVITLVDEWNDVADRVIRSTDSEICLSGNTWLEGPINSIEVVGEVPPNFGRDYILFRPQPYRDHVLQKSAEGKFRNVCDYNVNVHDGEKIREDEVTQRQRSLINICAGCSSYLHDRLREELPERMDRSTIDEDNPFLCPHCGESPERFEHVEMLGGMFSYHEDGEQCGPWSGQAYLEWRLDGSNRK